MVVISSRAINGATKASRSRFLLSVGIATVCPAVCSGAFHDEMDLGGVVEKIRTT